MSAWASVLFGVAIAEFCAWRRERRQDPYRQLALRNSNVRLRWWQR